jgi:excisionase family DNA binding protein
MRERRWPRKRPIAPPKRPHFPARSPGGRPIWGLCFPAGEEPSAAPIYVESERVARRCGHRRRSRSSLRKNVRDLATKRNLTITEAAELTGLSRKAIARRVERGSIRSVLRSGRRLIPRSELIRVGLLPPAGYSGVDQLTDMALSQSVAGLDTAGGEQTLLEALVRELLDRVQRQAGELAQYKALTAEAESLRLEREVADLRLRLSALEGDGIRRALEPVQPEDPRFSSAPPVAQAQRPFPAPLDDSLWLPPRAASEQARFGHDYMGAPMPARAPAADSRVSRSRILLLAVELLFIGLAAFLAWLADLGPVLAATTVAIAWLLAATLELVRWRSLKNHSQLDL